MSVILLMPYFLDCLLLWNDHRRQGIANGLMKVVWKWGIGWKERSTSLFIESCIHPSQLDHPSKSSRTLINFLFHTCLLFHPRPNQSFKLETWVLKRHLELLCKTFVLNARSHNLKAAIMRDIVQDIYKSHHTKHQDLLSCNFVC